MSEIKFDYVNPDNCPFTMMTAEQINAEALPKPMPTPPAEIPLPGKNYVFENNSWVLKPNPVADIVA